jgi:hypothetical protein
LNGGPSGGPPFSTSLRFLSARATARAAGGSLRGSPSASRNGNRSWTAVQTSVSCGARITWKTVPSPAPARLCADQREISLPSSVTRPRSGRRKPLTQWRRVDFPSPVRPDQAGERAALDGEGDLLHGLDGTEGLRDRVDHEGRRLRHEPNIGRSGTGPASLHLQRARRADGRADLARVERRRGGTDAACAEDGVAHHGGADACALRSSSSRARALAAEATFPFCS